MKRWQRSGNIPSVSHRGGAITNERSRTRGIKCTEKSSWQATRRAVIKMNEENQPLGEPITDLEPTALLVYSGKRILVTGAAGSIGSQLIKHLMRFAPARIAALDNDANAIAELEIELALRRTTIPVEPYVADIRDAARLGSICQSFAPQV